MRSNFPKTFGLSRALGPEAGYFLRVVRLVDCAKSTNQGTVQREAFAIDDTFEMLRRVLSLVWH
jgi:hypothetical protein